MTDRPDLHTWHHHPQQQHHTTGDRMTTDHDPTDIRIHRNRLIDGTGQDADDIRTYLPRLAALLADTGQHEDDGSAHRKISGSPAPWNTPIGHLLTDIHAGARQLADALTAALGHTRRPRGSGDAATMRALDHVARDAKALHYRDPERDLPRQAARQLAGWARQCRQALDELRPDEQPWTRAPGNLICPGPPDADDECGRSLWLAPGWQHQTHPPVYCLRCVDDEGQPYSWPHAAWYLAVTRKTA